MKPTTSKVLTRFIALLKKGDSEHGIAPHNAPDLLDRWSIAMETQVVVNASLGNPTDVKGVFEWRENPAQRYWPLRIPKGANTETPSFEDKPLAWPPELFATGIGCTGWNWKDQTSRWVGYDFDAISGHAQGVGVSDDELQRVREAACALPWVEVRRSTGGSGLHLYVLLDGIPTKTHTEHAGLARCILGMMSSETGFDFASRIDACGGNMWVWHRKTTPENRGMELIKAAEKTLGESDLPANWREPPPELPEFESVKLSEDHTADLAALGNPEFVPEKQCYRSHSKLLEQNVRRGRFQTVSDGTDISTPNCFIFPLTEGWRVVRYSPGTKEHPSWTHGKWTWTYWNRRSDLESAAAEFDGLPHRGGFVFPRFELAQSAIALILPGVTLPKPTDVIAARQVHVNIRSDRDGTFLVCKIKKETNDVFEGWIEAGRFWVREIPADGVATNHVTEDRVTEDVLWVVQPATGTGFNPVGWAVKIPEGWEWTSKDELLTDLMGKKIKNPQAFIAKAKQKRFHLEYVPFKPARYDNKLNMGCQYACKPADRSGPIPMTRRVLAHIGRSLNGPVLRDEWCRANGISNGVEFLIVVIANWLKRPELKSPLLFLFGPENCGKSTLHDLASYLIGSIADVDKIIDGDRFDDHLAGAVVAVIDEPDASEQKFRAKIRKWITEDFMRVNGKYRKQVVVPNYLHWIQMANDMSYAPAGPKDTRVVYLEVPLPENPMDRDDLKADLKREAPFFLRHCLDLKLPKPVGRFSVPVIVTEAKQRALQIQKTVLDSFIDERCEFVPPVNDVSQSQIPSVEFDTTFADYVREQGQEPWSARKVHAEMTKRNMKYDTGRANKGFLENVKWRA